MTHADLLSRAGVAAYLGVSTRTLDRLRREPGFPPGSAVGGRRRWRRGDIDLWLDSTPPAPQRGRRADATTLLGG